MDPARGNTVDEEARRDLCVRLFLDPAHFIMASLVQDAASLRTEPHRHENVMQFDLALQCAGSVTCDGTTTAVKSSTAIAFYPNARHSHALKIVSPRSEVITLKLAVDPSWPAIKSENLAKVTHLPANASLLARSMRRLAWLSASGRTRSLAALTALAETVSLWPAPNEDARSNLDWVESTGSLETLLELIDQSLSSPPDIREMADVASLSVRQLSRKFAALMGCSPHAYVTSRRVARAKELLGSGRMNVTEVAETLGFDTLQAFSRWFSRETKLNPSEFREHPPRL
jgi:AraC-like DNA-binding protein